MPTFIVCGVCVTVPRLNTGSDNYAFNSFQQALLPEIYRPPAGSYGANVT
jgi:hypothetical protein